MKEAPLAQASFFYRFLTACCVSSFFGSSTTGAGVGVEKASKDAAGGWAYCYCGFPFMKSNWKEGAGAWGGVGWVFIWLKRFWGGGVYCDYVPSMSKRFYYGWGWVGWLPPSKSSTFVYAGAVGYAVMKENAFAAGCGAPPKLSKSICYTTGAASSTLALGCSSVYFF